MYMAFEPIERPAERWGPKAALMPIRRQVSAKLTASPVCPSQVKLHGQVL